MTERRYFVVLGVSYVRLCESRSVTGSLELRDDGSKTIKYRILNLDLDELGDQSVKCFITFPEDWRRYCPNDRVWNRLWNELLRRWALRWGHLVGYWVKEFTEGRQAPHMNLVARWPDGAEGYDDLVERTQRLWVAEKHRDKYGARATRELCRGESAWWLRTTWAEIVTGNDGSEEARKHQARGVEIRVNYWGRGAEFNRRADVAWYVARDLGKERQKQVPEKFGRVRPWCGAENMREEAPVVEEIPYLVFVRMAERMRKWTLENDLPVPYMTLPGFGGITSPKMRAEEGAALLAEIEAEVVGDYDEEAF